MNLIVKTKLMIHMGCLALVATSVLACQGGTDWQERKFTLVDLSGKDPDVEVPQSLWDLMTKGGGEVEEKSSVLGSFVAEFVPFTVYLVEDHRGVLTNGDVELRFGPGGGDLDFAEFVSGRPGHFHFVVKLSVGEESDKEVRTSVYFLSNAKMRKIEGPKEIQNYGGGCWSYFDISKAFGAAMDNSGLLLSTVENRYVSAVAGTFFYVVRGRDKVSLAQLTVHDSRYPSLHCKQR